MMEGPIHDFMGIICVYWFRITFTHLIRHLFVIALLHPTSFIFGNSIRHLNQIKCSVHTLLQVD